MNKILFKSLFIIIMIALFGCAKKTEVISDLCLVIQPTRLNKEDKLSASTARKIYTDNEVIRIMCKETNDPIVYDK